MKFRVPDSDTIIQIPIELILIFVVLLVIAFAIYNYVNKKNILKKNKKEIQKAYNILKIGMFSNIVEEKLGENWRHISNRFLEDGSVEDVFEWSFEYFVDKGKRYIIEIECLFINNCLEQKEIRFI